jgi:hypothetical protein
MIVDLDLESPKFNTDAADFSTLSSGLMGMMPEPESKAMAPVPNMGATFDLTLSPEVMTGTLSAAVVPPTQSQTSPEKPAAAPAESTSTSALSQKQASTSTGPTAAAPAATAAEEPSQAPAAEPQASAVSNTDTAAIFADMGFSLTDESHGQAQEAQASGTAAGSMDMDLADFNAADLGSNLLDLDQLGAAGAVAGGDVASFNAGTATDGNALSNLDAEIDTLFSSATAGDKMDMDFDLGGGIGLEGDNNTSFDDLFYDAVGDDTGGGDFNEHFSLG